MDAGRGRLVYRFGDFALDAVQRVLVDGRSGLRVHLTPRAFDTLLYLLEHAGTVVTKSELMQRVWAGVVVEEGNLSQTIHVLRRALGESPVEHRYIVTEPRRGYRFVAAVRLEALPVSPVETLPPPVTATPARTRLSWHRLGIAATALVALGAGIHVQATRDGTASRPDVAATLDPRASGYLSQAQLLFHRRGNGDLQLALGYLEQAQRIAPQDASIPALMAGVYLVLRGQAAMDRSVSLARQREAAERALRLDPGLPEAHLRMAQYYWSTSNVALARQHFERGLALGPDRPLGLSMRAGEAARRGELQTAIELQRRSVELEPLAAVQRANLGIYLLAMGRWQEALAEFQRTEALSPGLVDHEIAFTLILQRKPEEALRRIQRWPAGPTKDQAMALAYDSLGRVTDADVALAQLRTSSDPDTQVRIAEVLAMRGERDEALAQIAAALAADTDRYESMPDSRESMGLALQLSPFLVALRSDRRWGGLMKSG